jgi:hypothetical protein
MDMLVKVGMEDAEEVIKDFIKSEGLTTEVARWVCSSLHTLLRTSAAHLWACVCLCLVRVRPFTTPSGSY